MTFTPPPGAGYVLNAGVWAPLDGTDPAGAGPVFTPPPVALYVYNSNLGQWVPWSGSGSGGGVQAISSPNGTISIGGTASDPTIDVNNPGFDLPNNAANVGVTTVYTVPASGPTFFVVWPYLVVTTPATTSSTLPAATIGWTDAETGTAMTRAATSTSGGNSLATYGQGEALIHAAHGSNITVQTTGYVSSGTTAMVYDIHVSIQPLR